ncbi:MAG: hypothetical protein ABIJ97_10040 [Bacteroidota bacterium]
MKKLLSFFSVVFILIPSFVQAFNAMSGGTYSIPASVVSGGGVAMEGGSYQLINTLGQSTPLELSGAASDENELYANAPGFWNVVNGMSAFDFWIKLLPGLNLFGYPVQIPGSPDPFQASDLLAIVTQIPETGQIQRYNGTSFDVLTTSGGDNFPILTGEGYYFYVEQSKNIPFHGLRDCAEIVVAQGVNLMTIQCPPSGYTSADMAFDLGGSDAVASIQRFNARTGAFETAAYIGITLTGSVFPIRRGEAYVVNMKQPGTLTFQ